MKKIFDCINMYHISITRDTHEKALKANIGFLLLVHLLYFSPGLSNIPSVGI